MILESLEHTLCPPFLGLGAEVMSAGSKIVGGGAGESNHESHEIHGLKSESLAETREARARLRLLALSAELTKQGLDSEMALDGSERISVQTAAFEVHLNTELGRRIIRSLAKEEPAS